MGNLVYANLVNTNLEYINLSLPYKKNIVFLVKNYSFRNCSILEQNYCVRNFSF